MIYQHKSGPIYYELIGEGPLVVTLHGFGLDHMSLKGPIERHIKGDYQRLYFDLPGMGKSQPTRVKNADEMLMVIKDLLAYLHVTSFHLITFSYGGYLAKGIMDMPLAKKALLFCPVIIPERGARSLPEVEEQASFSFEIHDEVEREVFLELSMKANQETYQRFKDEIMPGIHLENSSFNEDFQGRGYRLQEDYHQGFMHKPVRIVCGKKDNVVGYEEAYQLVKRLQQGDFILLRGVGHLLLQEEDALTGHILNDFLALE